MKGSGPQSRSVAVIGAGFAGLAAGDALSAAGWEVTVLEARDRVGGRVWSGRLDDGALVERGGEFITAGYDVTEEMTSRFGIELDGMGIDYPDRELVPDPGIGQGALAAAATEAAEHARDDPSVPFLDLLRRAVPDDATRGVLALRMQSALAFPATEIDARFALKLPELVRTEETRRIRGGNQELARALAAGLDVRLRCPVLGISHGAGSVRVSTDRDELTASACVVAMPVALLADLRFDPPLAEETTSAIASIRTGTAAKLAVSLRGGRDPMAVMSAADRFWVWTTPCDEVSGRSLGAWAGAGPVLEDLRVDDGPDRWLERVEILSPGLDLDHSTALLTVWERDPWAQGAYSVLPPTATEAAVTASTSPAANLVFAGEHTAEPGWTGTMEGALRSGRRAAGDLLGRGL